MIEYGDTRYERAKIARGLIVAASSTHNLEKAVLLHNGDEITVPVLRSVTLKDGEIICVKMQERFMDGHLYDTQITYVNNENCSGV